MPAARIGKFPDDIAQVVDAAKLGMGRRGMIQRGEGAPVPHKTAPVVTPVDKKSDDLACVVDAVCKSEACGGQGIIEGGKAAAAQQEAVPAATRVEEIADDQPRVVDALCNSVNSFTGGRGIIDR